MKKLNEIPLLHKILGTNQDNPDEMQPKEVLSYSIAGFGQNLICQLVTSFFLFFLTDAVGINPIWLAIMFLCARLFDAFNDPIMGTIVDMTRSKYGKMRPWLLYMPIPICIFTVLMFISKDIGEVENFIYATVIYVMWGICYTTVDVPYWGLASSMTSDTDKRNTMLTIARLFCTIGAGVVTVFIPIFQNIVRNSAYGSHGILRDDAGTIIGYLDSAGKEVLCELKDIPTDLISAANADLISGYKTLFVIVAIVVVVIALPTFYIGFKNTKERFYDENANKAGLLHNIKLLGKNKPVLLMIATGVLGSLRLIYMTSGLYYAKYNLGDEAIFSTLTLLVVPGGLIATLTTPWLSKKIGKRNLFLYSHLLGGAAMLGLYFLGLSSNGTSTASQVFFYIVMLILGLPSGYSNILTYSMIGDSIDYLEDRTGERAEGICFSMQTFISKIGMAMTAFVVLLVLGTEGYADADKLTGANAPLEGIWMMTTLLSGASTLACCIPLLFYDFTEKKQAECVARIEARKAAKLAESAGSVEEAAENLGVESIDEMGDTYNFDAGENNADDNKE